MTRFRDYSPTILPSSLVIAMLAERGRPMRTVVLVGGVRKVVGARQKDSGLPKVLVETARVQDLEGGGFDLVTPFGRCTT